MKRRVSYSITGRGKRQNTWCTGMVMMKQRIIGSQRKISSMPYRFQNSISVITSFSAIVYQIGLATGLCQLLAMISDQVLLQGYTELLQYFMWALLLLALMFYTHKAGPSWFLSLCEVARVLRGLPAILAFRAHIIPTHLFCLCYNYVFVFNCLGWIGMLY